MIRVRAWLGVCLVCAVMQQLASAAASSAPGTPASTSWRMLALKRWIARSVVRARLIGVVMAQMCNPAQ